MDTIIVVRIMTPHGASREELEEFLQEYSTPGRGPSDGTRHVGYGGQARVEQRGAEVWIVEDSWDDGDHYLIEANTPLGFRQALALAEHHDDHKHDAQPELWRA
jgi:hypothetical protein